MFCSGATGKPNTLNFKDRKKPAAKQRAFCGSGFNPTNVD
jgi:hypothetical protein